MFEMWLLKRDLTKHARQVSFEIENANLLRRFGRQTQTVFQKEPL